MVWSGVSRWQKQPAGHWNLWQERHTLLVSLWSHFTRFTVLTENKTFSRLPKLPLTHIYWHTLGISLRHPETHCSTREATLLKNTLYCTSHTTYCIYYTICTKSLFNHTQHLNYYEHSSSWLDYTNASNADEVVTTMLDSFQIVSLSSLFNSLLHCLHC